MEIRKGKSVALFIAPLLKMIETDVENTKQLCLMPPMVLPARGLAFRSVSSLNFILENCYNLTGELADNIPQLLSFREVVCKNLKLLEERWLRSGQAPTVELKLLVPWLNNLELLVEIVFRDLKKFMTFLYLS